MTKMMRKVFCDMDGVLADFDTGYEARFGVRPSKAADDVDWAKIASVPGFYKELPLMPDALELWDFLLPYKPTILTGVPWSVAEAPANKLAWATKHFPGAEIITCRSKEKSLHCRPGDVLIDDWDRYKKLWLAKGGHWVTHTSAASSIAELKKLGL